MDKVFVRSFFSSSRGGLDCRHRKCVQQSRLTKLPYAKVSAGKQSRKVFKAKDDECVTINLFQSGFVLVTTMFFLLILNFLALGILEMGLMESKMAGFYQNKMKSFYQAEKSLLKFEGEISKNTEIIKTNICGVNFYRFKAVGSYRDVKTCLESIIARRSDELCEDKPSILGRQSFSIVNCVL